MRVRSLQYVCGVCSFEMIRPQYNVTYENGRILTKTESKEGVCCGKKMSRRIV